MTGNATKKWLVELARASNYLSKKKKLRLQKSNAVMLSQEFYVTNVKTAITRAGKIKKLTNHTLNWIVKLPSN